MSYAFWADVVGLTHAAIVVFVVGGQAAILLGWAIGWDWTRNLTFRRAHLTTIAIVMAIAALGQWCPLTLLESHLRQRAGEAGFEQGFIATWLDRLLYYDAPLEVFIAIYAAFTALVAWSYWKYPPVK
ncbi:DUF2784 domain-containing protein [Pseudomonadota bacterium]